MLKLIVAVSILFASVPGLSATTDRFNFWRVENLAMVMGSFDPPHLDHQLTIEWIARQRDIDAVLVLPNSYAPHKPNMSSYEHRWNMMATLYRNHPRIIIPTLVEGRIKHARQILKGIQNSYPSMKIIGYMGEDLADAAMKSFFIKLYWGVDEWRTIGRSANASSGQQIPGKVGLSSSKLRNDIQGHRHFLDESVFQYIEKNQMYSFAKPNCTSLF